MLREARPDAIAIGTRCNWHAPYAVELANAGVPLLRLFKDRQTADYDWYHQIDEAYRSVGCRRR